MSCFPAEHVFLPFELIIMLDLVPRRMAAQHSCNLHVDRMWSLLASVCNSSLSKSCLELHAREIVTLVYSGGLAIGPMGLVPGLPGQRPPG